MKVLMVLWLVVGALSHLTPAHPTHDPGNLPVNLQATAAVEKHELPTIDGNSPPKVEPSAKSQEISVNSPNKPGLKTKPASMDANISAGRSATLPVVVRRKPTSGSNVHPNKPPRIQPARPNKPSDKKGQTTMDPEGGTTTLDPLTEFCKEACEMGIGGPECDCPDHPIG